MPAWAIIIIIVVCVLVAAAAAVGAARELRMLAMRRQFGPEFDRLARRVGSSQARAELMKRKQRVGSLAIRPLAPDRQRDFASSWTAAQEQFVEVPSEAVATAAQLVTEVAQERGYQIGDRARLLADLSVNHARRVEGYRRAEELAADPEIASTEDLRQAMLWYRAMFRDLAGPAAPSSRSSSAPSSPAGGDRPAASRPGPARLPRLRLPMPSRPRVALRRPAMRVRLPAIRRTPQRTPPASPASAAPVVLGKPAPPPQSLWSSRQPFRLPREGTT